MTDATPTPDTGSLAEAATLAAAPGVAPEIQSAARWFWWIAGLSVVNTVMTLSGSQTNFVMGLGFTAVVDALFEGLRVVGFAIDLFAVAFFVAMGWFGTQGRLWAFVLGMVLYALDGAIYLLADDIMPVAFHALALFFIGRGALLLRQAQRAG